jgi:hypothetical protein
MTHRQTVEEWFAALPFDAGDNRLDDDGELLMTVESETVVRLRVHEELGMLSLCAYLVELPETGDAEFFKMLLQSNYLLSAGQSISLAVDPEGRSVVTVFTHPIEDLTADQFGAMLATFVANSLLIRNGVIVTAAEREASQSAAAQVPQADAWLRI